MRWLMQSLLSRSLLLDGLNVPFVKAFNLLKKLQKGKNLIRSEIILNSVN